MSHDAVNVTLRMPKEQAERIKDFYNSLENEEVTIQSVYKNLLFMGLDNIESGVDSPDKALYFDENKQIEKLIDFTTKALNGKGPMSLPLEDVFIFNTNLKKVAAVIKKHRPELNALGFEKVLYLIGKPEDTTIIRIIMD